MSEVAPGAAGWRPDPFGRHEARFFDGSDWTPYVKDGDEHALDEPVTAVAAAALGGPEILTESVLVVGHAAEGAAHLAPHEVFAADGRRVGSLQGAVADAKHLDVLDVEGTRVASIDVRSGRKRTLVVQDGFGTEVGRLVQQQRIGGMTSYAMESPVGGELGAVRARTWAGWDIRIEDENARTIARVSKTWEGLDRSVFVPSDAYVVRVDHHVPDPLRTLSMAVALTIDPMFRQDARG